LVNYEAIIKACGPYINGSGSDCATQLDQAYNQIGNIWVYDVYDVCGNEVVLPHTAASVPRAPNNPLVSRGLGITDPVPCTELASVLGNAWMNSALVKAAIHVDKAPVGPWTVCANIDYSANTVTLLDRYPTLIANYRVLIYGGDADACVPWNGSEEWTRQLGYNVLNEWHPYSVSADGRSWTAGFKTDYDTPKGFSFITIKHAGHMVPQYEPEAGIFFFQNFLKGTPY